MNGATLEIIETEADLLAPSIVRPYLLNSTIEENKLPVLHKTKFYIKPRRRANKSSTSSGRKTFTKRQIRRQRQ